MTWQKVKIQMDEYNKGHIWIDDKEIAPTTGFKVESFAGGLQLVTIYLLTEKFEYEGTATVTMSDEKAPTPEALS
jgi:hypothetical protein